MTNRVLQSDIVVDHREALAQASTLAELDALYVLIVGYSRIAEDDTRPTVDDLRATLAGYLDEWQASI